MQRATHKVTTLQEIKCVYGLKGRADYDPMVVRYGPLDVMSMDAPNAFPAGSMCAEGSYGFPGISERVTFRDGAPPWRQGADRWKDGKELHTALREALHA